MLNLIEELKMKKPSGFIKERVENVKNSTKKIVGTEDIKKNFEYIKETSKVLITPDKSDKSNKNIRKITRL